MKKYLRVLLVALVLSVSVLGLTGCGKKEEKITIVGKWQSKEYSSYVYTFNKDGTGEYSGMKFTYTTEGDKISIQYEGSTVPFESTYEINGKELNIKDSFGNDTIYIRK